MSYLLLALVGLVAGTLNVLAGGGSFLTLPVLIFVGLPATVANGTNRVGVLAQNLTGVWGFHRHGLMDWRWLPWAGIPAVVGALFGVWGALRVSDEAFRRILAFFMLALTLWTLTDPVGRRRRTREASWNPTLVVVGFFLAGLYGGFIQAGVGFFLLAVTTLAGLDLVRGNAVKMMSVLLLTGFSLVIFASQNAVDWPSGLSLAAGNIVGATVGVRLAVLKGHRWVRGVVTVAIVVFAVRLWFS